MYRALQTVRHEGKMSMWKQHPGEEWTLSFTNSSDALNPSEVISPDLSCHSVPRWSSKELTETRRASSRIVLFSQLPSIYDVEPFDSTSVSSRQCELSYHLILYFKNRISKKRGRKSTWSWWLVSTEPLAVLHLEDKDKKDILWLCPSFFLTNHYLQTFYQTSTQLTQTKVKMQTVTGESIAMEQSIFFFSSFFSSLFALSIHLILTLLFLSPFLILCYSLQ